MSSDFDWSDINVVIHEQPQSGVYLNPNGQLVIRQLRNAYEDEDPFLYFSLENVPALVRAIIDTAGIEPADVWPQQQLNVLPAPIPATGAERSKRYRQRKRDDGVTNRDARRHATTVTPLRDLLDIAAE
jgi:hypothetical protein